MTDPLAEEGPVTAPSPYAHLLERYELLAAHSRDIMLFVRRDDGRIVEANAAAARAYGYSREELLSLTIHDLRAPEAAPGTLAQLEEADRRGILLETVHRRRDGSTFPVEVSAQGGQVEGGRTLLSVIRDVSERRAAERALREREERLQLLIEHTPASVALFDRELRYLAYSRRFLRDYDLEGQDLLGRSHYEVFPEIPERWREIHRRCLAGAVERCDEDPFPRADGTVNWLRWEIRPWRTAAGEVGGLVLFSEDITEYKHAMDRLREADQQKQDYLFIASHDLRSPLTSLRLQSELLARRLRQLPGADERALRHVASIERQTHRLEELLATLLDISRIDGGTLTLDRVPIDLAELAREVVERLRPEAERVGAELQLRASPARGTWDRLRLDQVLTNLVSNAIKYGEKRPVEIEVGPAQGGAQLRVRDHGIGIPASSRERLFERFARGDNAAAFGGLGLGLWLTRKLIEAHGGRIAVDSAQGQGSTFTVTLPAPRPAAG